jgi:hypothetical protein
MTRTRGLTSRSPRLAPLKEPNTFVPNVVSENVAGTKVHFGGQKMTCGKGADCPFDHASAELRAARVASGLQQKRFRYAPTLWTEVEILAHHRVDVYTYGGLSPEDMVCLEMNSASCLQIATCDFMDSRFLPSSCR